MTGFHPVVRRKRIKQHNFLVMLIITAITCILPAQAHHTTAKFDFDNGVLGVIHGAIKLADFRNPHALIILEVTGEGGQITEHRIEGHSLNIVRRSGLKFGMVQPGDKVTVIYAPSTTDTDKYMRALLLSDGTILNPSVTAVPADVVESAKIEGGE